MENKRTKDAKIRNSMTSFYTLYFKIQISTLPADSTFRSRRSPAAPGHMKSRILLHIYLPRAYGPSYRTCTFCARALVDSYSVLVGNVCNWGIDAEEKIL